MRRRRINKLPILLKLGSLHNRGDYFTNIMLLKVAFYCQCQQGLSKYWSIDERWAMWWAMGWWVAGCCAVCCEKGLWGLSTQQHTTHSTKHSTQPTETVTQRNFVRKNLNRGYRYSAKMFVILTFQTTDAFLTTYHTGCSLSASPWMKPLQFLTIDVLGFAAETNMVEIILSVT